MKENKKRCFQCYKFLSENCKRKDGFCTAKCRRRSKWKDIKLESIIRHTRGSTNEGGFF